MTRAPTRLAIVGGGPRAAYALDCLARQAAAHAAPPSRVDVYEPRAVLGTGPAYDRGQPDWARLNLPAQLIDAGAVVTENGLTRSPNACDLTTWLDGEIRYDSGPHGDLYPPRSRAGDYLAQLARTSIAALAPTVVSHRRHEVHSIQRSGDTFHLGHTGGEGHYDAVLLATGHALTWRGQLGDVVGGVPCLPTLPLGRLIERAEELRPARVCVRGASLTAIDAVLGLTEGLGGAFTPSVTSGYRPGNPEVHLTLVGRTGRLMDVKPESEVLRRYGTAEAVADVLATWPGEADIGELLAAAATRILSQASQSWSAAPDCAAQVEEALRLLGVEEPPDPRARLEVSLAQARGLAAPDATWALGQAWRAVYPSLVRRQQRLSRLDATTLCAPLAWRDYHRLRPELERLAFGPPPINAEKLVTLMAAGRLDVATARPEEFGAVVADSDLVVDAVSAPAGVRDVEDPLWQQLLADGLVSVAPYGRGILVDAAAGCLDLSGALVSGLSAVGRATEDVVLGNDTLTRTMHDHLENWAQRLCRTRELAA